MKKKFCFVFPTELRQQIFIVMTSHSKTCVLHHFFVLLPFICYSIYHCCWFKI